MSGRGDVVELLWSTELRNTMFSTRHLAHLVTDRHACEILRFYLRVPRQLRRVDRGVYFMSDPLSNAFPDVGAIARFRAESLGEMLQIHGADAAREFGLDAPPGDGPRFYTTGRTRTMRVDGCDVRFRHVPAVVTLHAWEPAGAALAALFACGPDAAAAIRANLHGDDRHRIRALLSRLPDRLARAWLAADPGARVPFPPAIPLSGGGRAPGPPRRLRRGEAR